MLKKEDAGSSIHIEKSNQSLFSHNKMYNQRVLEPLND